MANTAPYFSIIVPVFNRPQLLQRALKSCENQIFLDFEVVVVDDGSEVPCKETELKEGFSKLNLRVVTHKLNSGLNHARSTGINHARGKWIVFLDSDDELFPYCLKIMQERIELDAASHMLYGFPWKLSDESFNKVEKLVHISTSRDFLRWAASKNRPSDLLCCLYREALKIQPYPTWHKAEFFFFLQFSLQFPILYIYGEPVGIVHYDAVDSLSRSKRKFTNPLTQREKDAVPLILSNLSRFRSELIENCRFDYYTWLRFCLRISVLSLDAPRAILIISKMLRLRLVRSKREFSQ